jgi:hypothetical protein
MPIDLDVETILSTVTNTSYEGPVTKTVKKHTCSGYVINSDGTREPKNYIRTITERCGPASVMKRRKWSPFGDKPHPQPTFGEDVFLKLQDNTTMEEDKRSSDCNFYCGMAVKCKFTALEHYAVKHATNPQEKFIQILNENYYNIKPTKQTLRFARNADTERPVLQKNSISALMANARQKKADDEHLLTVMIDNIPTWYTIDDIRDQLVLANLKSNVDRINVVRQNPDREQTTGGKAFIVWNTIVNAQKGLEYLNGARWDHYIISAQISKPREKKNKI